MFPLIVFTGANAPTTIERFPRGEAVHYREHAISLGVPDYVILAETRATKTGENITLSRPLLDVQGVHPVTLVTLGPTGTAAFERLVRVGYSTRVVQPAR